MRNSHLLSLLVAAWVLLPFVAGADTTGQLRGSVTDEQGAPLAGVSVSAGSPAQIGGEQLASTDARGEFRYPVLAPGDYTVRLSLDGYVTQELTEVRVRLERTTQLQVTMAESTFEDEIVVAETTPVVDPEQTSAGQVFTAEYLEKASIGMASRNYLSVPEQTAGVQRNGADSYRVHGSRGWENSFRLDGISIAGPWASSPDFDAIGFDAIQEVAVHTAGFGAESGLASGGVINVLTKSGGNRFEGSVDLRYRDNDFEEAGDQYDPDETPFERRTLNAALGGPVLRDRLWFFVSGTDRSEDFTPVATPYSTDAGIRVLLGKLSWQASPSWSLLGRYLDEDTEVDRDRGDQFRAEEATAFTAYEPASATLEWTGILSPTLIWTGHLGELSTSYEEIPFTRDLTTIGHLNYFTGQRYGNLAQQFYNDWGNQEVRTDLSWFVPSALGTHEIQGGLRYAQIDFGRDACNNGSGRKCTPGDEGFGFGDVLDPATGRIAPGEMLVQIAPGRVGAEGTERAAYLQDSWRPRPDLTLHLGLRWDDTRQNNTSSSQEIEFGELQPRLGVAWDLRGNGRNLLRASWGRYMPPSTLVLGDFFLGEGLTPVEWWEACSLPVLFGGLGLTDPEACAAAVDGSIYLDYRTDPESWDPAGWLLYQIDFQQPNRVADNLTGMQVDHLVLALERELFRRTSLELGFVHKDFDDIFDDTCIQNYPEPAPSNACPSIILANIPEARRDYQAWTLRFESRALDRLHAIASWVWADSQGSVDPFVVNWDFDVYPLQYVNRYGYLPDNGHRVKINGFVELPWGLLLAAGGEWSSEIRWTPQRPLGIRGSTFLEPRGNRKEDGLYNLDLQLSKGIQIGRTRLQLIGTVYNALDTEQPTAFCSNATGCGDFALGDPIDWQRPRSYEVGMRLEF